MQPKLFPSLSTATALTTLIATGFAVTTNAQAEDRWYVGLTGLTGSVDVSAVDANLQPGVPGSASLDTDTGFGWGGSFGREFGDHWRAEIEIVYRSNDVSSLRTASGADFSSGDYASLIFGANGFYTFGDKSDKWRPYLGAGLGLIQEVDIDIEDATGESSFSGDGVAAQLMAGISYQPSVNWSLDFEARYLTASDIDLDAEQGSYGGRITADYDVLSLGAVLRYRF